MADIRQLLLDWNTEEVVKLCIENDANFKTLVRLLKDSSDVVRQRAVEALTEIGTPYVVEHLLYAMDDPSEDVRVQAAIGLELIKNEIAIPRLFRALKDESHWVVSHAAAALSQYLPGPIWARVDTKDIDIIITDFPDMSEEDIKVFFKNLKVDPSAVERFLELRRKGFRYIPEKIEPPSKEEVIATLPKELLDEISPDMLKSMSVEELQEYAKEWRSRKEISRAPVEKKDEVSEVPEKKEEETVEEILSRIPPEFLSSFTEEQLKSLTVEDAKLIEETYKSGLTSEKETKPEKPKKKPKKKAKKKSKVDSEKERLLSELPDSVREALTPDIIESLSIEDLKEMVRSAKVTSEEEMKETEEESRESTGDDTEAERKRLLSLIPPDMLPDLPAEELEKMNVEQLRALLEALGVDIS